MCPMQSVNPATEEILTTFDSHDDGEIEKRLARAAAAFPQHKAMPVMERAERLRAAADILEGETERYAQLLTAEMGKTFAAAKSEVQKCAWACRFYAEHGPVMLQDEPIETSATRSFRRFLPIGPVLAVMPWNFPFWQVFRFAAPAMMVGNVGLLKHASNVPQAALAIEDIFRRAGFVEGAFQTLLVGSDKIENILKDERVKAATLTGSEKAGRAVAQIAGDQIKKTVLELGGSDAFLVMPSADLDAAVDNAVKGRIINNGQSCIAAKRFIVHADIYEDFKARFVEKFEALKVGDPMAEATDIGPLAMAQIRNDLDEQVEDAVKCGAQKLCGCEKQEGKGFFYTPGILENVPKSARAYNEELFGPVAMLFKAADLDAAIKLANTTRFGLGSAIFTQDKEEMEEAALRLEAGSTFINTIVASDPRLPFGGVKASGYGRELAVEGLREFTNIKTICEGASS